MHFTKVLQTTGLCIALVSTSNAYSEDLFYKKNYESFEVVINCKEKGLQFYKANVGKDTGNKERKQGKFQIDPSVPKECQQTSARTYGYGYHRGHLQGANTSENSLNAYKETFFMTNVLPMTKELNTGAWHYSDEIIECLRDQGQPLVVYGGAIWDGAHSNDFTLNTHGIRVPSGFWKVIKKGSQQIAWIMPNSKAAIKDTLKNWEVTVSEIQNIIGFDIPEDLNLDVNYRTTNWYKTSRCDLK
jgi:endonuclease G